MDLSDHALIMLEMSAGDKTSASGISAFRFNCARWRRVDMARPPY